MTLIEKNITKLAKKIGCSRETVYEYLRIAKTDYSNFPDYQSLKKNPLLRISKQTQEIKPTQKVKTTFLIIKGGAIVEIELRDSFGDESESLYLTCAG